MTTRRRLIALFLASAATGQAVRAAAVFPLTLTKAEWRARLNPAQVAILREEETERAFSSGLMGNVCPPSKEARAGTCHCAGCANPVYLSSTRYDSSTGWPSFRDA
jgi:peptide-methionine (R)-S-oxide reductase